MVPQVVVGQSVTVGGCIQAKTSRSDVSTVANVERTTAPARSIIVAYQMTLHTYSPEVPSGVAANACDIMYQIIYIHCIFLQGELTIYFDNKLFFQ